MLRASQRITIALLVVATTAGLAHTASADRSKLDPRARVALAQIEQGETEATMKMRGAAVFGESDLDVFIIGSVSRAELEAAGARVRTELPGLYTAYIPASAVDAVSALGGVMSIQGSAPCEPELAVSVPTTGANLLRGAGPAFTGLNGAGVILGDVDSGVDFGHGDFKDAGGLTRFVNIWDQNTADAPPPGGFGYGSEWDAASINANICTELDNSASSGGHGTHVMGIQGGDGSQTGGVIPAFSYAGMAPMADLIMVKTTFQTSAVVDGVNYVFQRATALGKNAACNLSLGSHFGPHDGTDAFEAGLSALTGPGRLIAKSAGNERTLANHAEVFATAGGTNATMTITGGTAVGRAFAIDGYYEATENLSVQITTPGGTIIGPIALGGSSGAYPGPSTTNGNVYLENGLSLTATGDKEVYIEINNTTSVQNQAGTWTFRFFAVTLGAANGEVDMWRFFNNTTTANFVLGNQAGEEKVSEPGNAVELITTAAYASRVTWTDCNNGTINFTGAPAAGALATFSSPGPTRDGRQKPDIAAPGTPIASSTSFDLAVACGAGAQLFINDAINHVVNQGTSMAAPHVTGALALILQKYGAITPAFAKAFLNGRAKVDAQTGAVWNKDWGNGKLFLGDMVDPVVIVTAPNGGESFTVGQNVNLTWNATDALGGVTSVDLLLSRTGVGGPYSVIATGQPNTGSYAWVATGPATNQAILRVVASDAALNTGKDESDQDWRIDDAVPAVMQYFDAEQSGDGEVTLRWQFEDEGEYRVLDLERSDVREGPFAVVDAERTIALGSQVAIDRTAVAGHTYFYRLAATMADNSKLYFGPIMATVDGPTLAFGLSRVAPNPSVGPVGVDFSLARDAKVRVAVVNVLGREVAELADGVFNAGVHHVSWDRAASGVPAGLYFVVYHTPTQKFAQRVVVTN